jgi:hypothetical protein
MGCRAVIEKIISGGQTGADQAGLRAAKRFGIPTGGWAPRGWLVEKPGGGHGSNPSLRDYGLIECPAPCGEKPPYMQNWEWTAKCYKARTAFNAEAGDATVWFDFAGPSADSRGYWATRSRVPICRPFVTIERPSISIPPNEFVEKWGAKLNGVINIAGNRESKSPGVGAWVELYLAEVFRLLGFQEKKP